MTVFPFHRQPVYFRSSYYQPWSDRMRATTENLHRHLSNDVIAAEAAKRYPAGSADRAAAFTDGALLVRGAVRPDGTLSSPLPSPPDVPGRRLEKVTAKGARWAYDVVEQMLTIPETPPAGDLAPFLAAGAPRGTRYSPRSGQVEHLFIVVPPRESDYPGWGGHPAMRKQPGVYRWDQKNGWELQPRHLTVDTTGLLPVHSTAGERRWITAPAGQWFEVHYHADEPDSFVITADHKVLKWFDAGDGPVWREVITRPAEVRIRAYQRLIWDTPDVGWVPGGYVPLTTGPKVAPPDSEPEWGNPPAGDRYVHVVAIAGVIRKEKFVVGTGGNVWRQNPSGTWDSVTAGDIVLLLAHMYPAAGDGAL